LEIRVIAGLARNDVDLSVATDRERAIPVAIGTLACTVALLAGIHDPVSTRRNRAIFVAAIVGHVVSVITHLAGGNVQDIVTTDGERTIRIATRGAAHGVAQLAGAQIHDTITAHHDRTVDIAFAGLSGIITLLRTGYDPVPATADRAIGVTAVAVYRVAVVTLFTGRDVDHEITANDERAIGIASRRHRTLVANFPRSPNAVRTTRQRAIRVATVTVVEIAEIALLAGRRV
jgi:hypothetical protein